MTWADTRAELASIIGGVDGVRRVFEFRPSGNPGDIPCVVMRTETLVVSYGASRRTKEYRVYFDVLTHDERVESALEVATRLREAIIDAFDNAMTLNGGITGITGVEAGQAESGTAEGLGTGSAVLPMVVSGTVHEARTFGP
jgi:hypothetical protein